MFMKRSDRSGNRGEQVSKEAQRALKKAADNFLAIVRKTEPPAITPYLHGLQGTGTFVCMVADSEKAALER